MVTQNHTSAEERKLRLRIQSRSERCDDRGRTLGPNTLRHYGVMRRHKVLLCDEVGPKKTGPQAKVHCGAIHRACEGAERWSRNGGDTRRPTSFGLRWKRSKAARRLAGYRVNTRFIPT